MWEQMITQIVLSIVGVVGATLGGFLTKWINKKIKNEQVKEIFNGALNIVNDGVNYVYQTYVESLKGTDFWNEEAMKTANEKAVEYIKTHLTPEAINYIKENKGDLETWIKEQVEIAIKNSKDKNKTV